MTDRDKLEADEFGEVIVDDPDWNPIRRQIFYSEIMEGSHPDGAAAQAGIAPRKFKQWMRESETFRMYVEYLVAISRGILRKKVVSAINDLETAKDPDKVATQTMKLLERIDPEFGTKHIDINENVKELKKPKRDYTELIKEAEDAANKDVH